MDKKSATIDGVTYDVTTLDAYAAVPVFTRVAKVLVPTLDSISSSGAALAAMTGGGKGVSEIAVLGKLVTGAGAALVKLLDPVDLRFVIDAFAARTDIHLGGKEPKLTTVFADHFAGNLTGMAKWLHFCLEVNFGDFLEVARGMWTSAQKAKPASDAANGATATPPSESRAASIP